MKKGSPIDDRQLDELLRQYYLDAQSRQINEQEARRVFSSDYEVRINKEKERELLKRLNRGNSGLWNSGFFLSLVVALIAAGALLAYYLFQSNNELVSQEPIYDQVPGEETAEIIGDEKNTAPINHDNKISLTKMSDTFARTKIIAVPVEDNDTPLAKRDVISKSTEAVRTDISIPILPVKDKTRYLKIKEMMINRLISEEEGFYSRVPPAKISYADSLITLNEFTIRNVAITNLEYKTFLADLLIQKKHNEYLVAQVFPENWINYQCFELANTYFQEEKYNDYPVVNITDEGTTAFCHWLESETNFYIQKNFLKTKAVRVRLPFVDEMIRAALDGYARFAYEEGYNTIYDPSEPFVDDRFAARAETIRKRAKRADTLYTVLITNKYGWNENKLLDFLNKGFQYFNIHPMDTLYPDRVKVFGKIGRVSEVVLQRGTSRIWLVGQSWKSKEQYRQFEEEYKLNLSSPFAGFRPLVIQSDAADYKNPFW